MVFSIKSITCLQLPPLSEDRTHGLYCIEVVMWRHMMKEKPEGGLTMTSAMVGDMWDNGGCGREETSQKESCRMLCLVWAGVSITITNHTCIWRIQDCYAFFFRGTIFQNSTKMGLLHFSYCWWNNNTNEQIAARHYYIQCSRHTEIIWNATGINSNPTMSL